MAISRNIRAIWITDYDKAIGDVAGYLDSGSGEGPVQREIHDRSTITGVREIKVGGYFWGTSLLNAVYLPATFAELDEDLIAGDTTITLDDAGSFGGTTEDPGYVVIENEIIKYTGTSGGTNLTGCVRGQFDTTDVQHDGTASTIYAYQYLRGVVQSVDYEPEDEVYAIRVAIGAEVSGVLGNPLSIYGYLIFRFEFSKSVVDLILYEDTENPTTISSGHVPGFAS
jgi:hypothetical protein